MENYTGTLNRLCRVLQASSMGRAVVIPIQPVIDCEINRNYKCVMKCDQTNIETRYNLDVEHMKLEITSDKIAEEINFVLSTGR